MCDHVPVFAQLWWVPNSATLVGDKHGAGWLQQAKEKSDPELLCLDTDAVLFTDPGFKCETWPSGHSLPHSRDCVVSALMCSVLGSAVGFSSEECCL